MQASPLSQAAGGQAGRCAGSPGLICPCLVSPRKPRTLPTLVCEYTSFSPASISFIAASVSWLNCSLAAGSGATSAAMSAGSLPRWRLRLAGRRLCPPSRLSPAATVSPGCSTADAWYCSRAICVADRGPAAASAAASLLCFSSIFRRTSSLTTLAAHGKSRDESMQRGGTKGAASRIGRQEGKARQGSTAAHHWHSKHGMPAGCPPS